MFSGGQLLLLTGREVSEILKGQELEVVRHVAQAYACHARAQTSIPHSAFLRFRENPQNRIGCLPAYLGGEFDVAGMKWIASFSGNVAEGIERASGLIILNSMKTGRPEAVIEGSLISAQRTAASAALAADVLHNWNNDDALGILGCGRINLEIVRFVTAMRPVLRRIFVFDLDPARAREFASRVETLLPGSKVLVQAAPHDVFRQARLISFATTALSPHIADFPPYPLGATILHISLRDLTTSLIRRSDNVVDDPDHVCRERTSLHLAEKESGGRDFIRCTLGSVLLGQVPARITETATVIFSPFGLGILDLAVAAYVRRIALQRGYGQVLRDFCRCDSAVSLADVAEAS